MIALLADWIGRYPIVSIEDPLAEDDPTGFAAFTRRSRRPRCRSSATTSWSATPRACARPPRAGAANTVLLKPNQRGTLTETLEAWQAAQERGFAGIVSARSGETEDTTIVHLAVGWGVGQFKVGSFARGERMAKWNEALRIEEALGAGRQLRRRRARWGGRGGDRRACRRTRPGGEARDAGAGLGAHLVSHFHHAGVPAAVPAADGTGWASGFVEIGLALTLFNVVSALTQAPMGFLVDRIGARAVLVGGWRSAASPTCIAGLWPTYPMLLVASALIGLANSAYHPADYAIALRRHRRRADGSGLLGAHLRRLFRRGDRARP